MAPTKVILLACGSFNPPTNMHLRMFELARDNLNRLGQYLVIGGIISPVHDAYGKKELIPATLRCEMLKLALRSSDWIQISDWECTQETWSRTRRVLQHHQNLLNSVLSDERDCPNNNQRNDLENGYNYSSWITNDIRNSQGPVQIKLLCGADLLESFATPGLWSEEDIESIIGQHGLVVITRQGSNPQRFIYESDLLTKYQHNIMIVTEWIHNDVSSTKVRRALRRQESVKYLIEDSVIEFIKKHGLYGTTKNDFKYKTTLNDSLNLPISKYILTPSPSDANMMSGSSSGHDIYLNLKPFGNRVLSEPIFEPEEGSSYRDETFESLPHLSFLTNKEKNERNQSKMFQYTNEAVRVDSSDLDKSPDSPGKTKKVGVSKSQAGNEEVRSQETEVQETEKAREESKSKVIESTDSTPGKGFKKPSKKHHKSADGKKIIKADSQKDEKQFGKGNLLLKRSQSDAIMSRKRENGETVSVKIQFTKDGIKVISDKESIV